MVLAPFPRTRAAIMSAVNGFLTAYGVEPLMMHMPLSMMKALKAWPPGEWDDEARRRLDETGKLPPKVCGMDVVYSAPFFALYAPNPLHAPTEPKDRPSAKERHELRKRQGR